MTAISSLASSFHQENAWLCFQPRELPGSEAFTLLWPNATHFMPEVTVTGYVLHMCPTEGPVGVESAVLLMLLWECVLCKLIDGYAQPTSHYPGRRLL